MDKRSAIINVVVSVISSTLVLGLSLVSRVLFWNRFGQEFFGIFTFVHSIIALVTIFGFGLNGMFKISLNRPIVDKNERDLIAAHTAFRKVNYLLTLVMLLSGFVLVFFIPFFGGNFQITPIIYAIFFILLFQIIIDRLSEPKEALIDCHLKGYKLSILTTAIYAIILVMKILMIKYMPSILYYAIIVLIGSIIRYICVTVIAKKNYNHILSKKEKLSKRQYNSYKKIIKRKALIALTSSLAASLSNIIIGLQFGVMSLAILANYEVLIRKVKEITISFVNPLNPTIAQYCITANREEKKEAYVLLHVYGLLITSIFMLGYYALISDLMSLLFSGMEEQLITKTLLMMLLFRTFLMSNRTATNSFMARNGLIIHKEAILMISGIFQTILLVFLPFLFGLYGAIAAPIITILLFHNLVAPILLYKKGFKRNPLEFFGLNTLLLMGFLVSLIILDYLMISVDNIWLSMFANGIIAFAIGITFSLLVFLVNKSLRTKLLIITKAHIDKMRNKESKQHSGLHDDDLVFAFYDEAAKEKNNSISPTTKINTQSVKT